MVCHFGEPHLEHAHIRRRLVPHISVQALTGLLVLPSFEAPETRHAGGARGHGIPLVNVLFGGAINASVGLGFLKLQVASQAEVGVKCFHAQRATPADAVTALAIKEHDCLAALVPKVRYTTLGNQVTANVLVR